MSLCSLCKGRKMVIKTDGTSIKCPACDYAGKDQLGEAFTGMLKDLGATVIDVAPSVIKQVEIKDVPEMLPLEEVKEPIKKGRGWPKGKPRKKYGS